MNNNLNYLSCHELMEKYPDVDLLGWTAQKIGYMYRCNLLIGKVSGRESKTLISEESFKRLIRYTCAEMQRKTRVLDNLDNEEY